MKTILYTIIHCFFATSALSGTWNSTAHFGFSVESESSVGFKGVSGSMAFLDAAYNLAPGDKLSLGVRSLMQGGRRPQQEYYRMGAGPMIGYAVSRGWFVHGSLTKFQETGLDDQGEKVYKSSGQTVMFGWERIFTISRRMEIAWGGFFTRHSGTLSKTAQINTLQSARSNVGGSQGVELALRMSL